MASPVRPVLPRLEPPASLRQPAALTDDLLQEIFLRIASPADLARTSTACISFSRLIADPSFLRRYHSTHPPLLLGFLSDDYGGREIFKPVEAPHPNSAAARALASALNFSFNDYLPPARWKPWYIQDVRHGRVLFSSRCDDKNVLPDLAVCDPLSRGSLLLPPMPEQFVQGHIFRRSDAVFYPSADATLFRVMVVVHSLTKLLVFVFNSTSSSWGVGSSTSWDSLSLSRCPIMCELPCHVYGCFYWKLHWMYKFSNNPMNGNKLLKLDMTTMEFSTVDLPPDHDEQSILVVEEGEGRIGIISHKWHGTHLNYYSSMQNLSQMANQWQMNNIIPVPVQDNLSLFRSAQGYIFLIGDSNAQDTVGMACFSLEIKSLKIERVSRMKMYELRNFPYFGFPPSMSLRRI
ncbi:unnamed protein product [Urochloa decumbens]|uniref:F-box protein AT5G49610-like beta-propeller domain-containing protein n=1 Tax=Urochloa decumbens TaxID=240449 RepID=A0ABC9G2Q2_9POAL